jgi:predicted esterase
MVVALVGCRFVEPQVRSDDVVFVDTTGQGHPDATLIVPSDDTPSSPPRPLLLFLDGFNGDGGVSAVARFQLVGYQDEGDGAFLLAPTGIVGSTGYRRWNASTSCCEPVQPANDDVGYLGGLIEQVLDRGWNVDRDRIFALGMSNGGSMALRLACERADLLDGVVAIAAIALPDTLPCSPSRHVHVAVSHSKADSLVLYQGGIDEIPITTGSTIAMPDPYPAVEGPGGLLAQAIGYNECTGGLPDPQPSDRTLDFDDHPGYPVGVMDTIPMTVAGCPDDGTVTFWQSPYKPPTCNHSLQTGSDFGFTMRAWIATHPRP